MSKDKPPTVSHAWVNARLYVDMRENGNEIPVDAVPGRSKTVDFALQYYAGAFSEGDVEIDESRVDYFSEDTGFAMSDNDDTPGMKLVRIDLSRGNGRDHPDIVPIGVGDERVLYLAKIAFDNKCDVEAVAGYFVRREYGLMFQWMWGTTGLEFNTPGTNSSVWSELHRIEM